MKKRNLALLLALTMVAASFVGCGDKKEKASDNGSVKQEAEDEGSEEGRYLMWRLDSEPKQWDPTNNSASVSDAICKQLFEGLTVSTSDGFKPGIAEKWDVSEDGKTYTFHLRKDAKWSDGSPVTAKDFEYSWRRICDPDFASEALQAITDYVVGATEYFEGTGEYDDIKATAIDDYTFEVVLKNATPFFPQLVANDVCEAIQQMLETNLNIKVKLRAEESSVFNSTKSKGDYEMAPGGWTNNPYDASGLIKLFYSQNGNNTCQWRWREYKGAPHDTTLNPGNKAFDEAFDKAMASLGKERDEAWEEANKALMDDMPITALYYPSFVALINEDQVENVELTLGNSFMFSHAEIVE